MTRAHAAVNGGGRSRSGAAFLIAVWGFSALWTFRDLDRGWIPHDEGALAQSAERVLEGELPHRDFDELYTGGLSALNALGFEVLGVNLLTPRLVLFAFFLAWVPALFYVTSRFAPPPVAAVATLLGATWSVPNYPAAMPSWYNLFFAVFGLAALLRHLDSGERRWLLVAGLAGGFSVLMKSAGLLFIAAGLLVIVNREQELSRRDTPVARPSGGGRGFSAFASSLLLLFAALLVLLVRGREGLSGILHFVAPMGAVAALLVWSEWTGGPRASAPERFRTLARLGLPFAAGVGTPLLALVAVYAWGHALPDLARGLLVSPTRRLSYAATPPPGASTLWVTLPFVGLLLLDRARSVRIRRAVAALVALAGVGLAVAPSARATFPVVWSLLNALGPVVTLGGVGWLALRRRRGRGGPGDEAALAALAVAGGVLLIQFPFSGAIYLFYALPALVPAALVGWRATSERPVFVAVMAFLLLFSVRWINSGALFRAGGFAYDPASATERLELPRGGNLRVPPADKGAYEQLIPALRTLSTSRYTFATPDLPEVYFLSGLRNPTRTLFDFFDPPEGRTRRILERLDADSVDVVVLNRLLRFSDPPPDDLLEGLRARYPRATLFDNFLVRWRERPAAPSEGSVP